MTLKWRRCDVVTSLRRRYDVMCLLWIWAPFPPTPLNILNRPPPQYSKPSYANDVSFFAFAHHEIWLWMPCKLLIILRWGESVSLSAAPRRHSSFSDDKAPGDLIPQTQVLDLLEAPVLLAINVNIFFEDIQRQKFLFCLL